MTTFHHTDILEELQLMWLTVASNSNKKMMHKLEKYNLHLLEYPVDENLFFDIFTEQLTSHPLMQDEGQVVTSETA